MNLWYFVLYSVSLVICITNVINKFIYVQESRKNARLILKSNERMALM